ISLLNFYFIFSVLDILLSIVIVLKNLFIKNLKRKIFAIMYPVFVPAPIPVSSRPTHSVVYTRPRYYYYQPHRTTVLVGDLPDDFLRVPILPASSQEEQDRAAAIHLQNQIIAQSRQPQVSGRYEISVVNAVLNKNYGLSRMDPLC
ncbi:Toll-interacting protein, partial [Armadillidium vulgare]